MKSIILLSDTTFFPTLWQPLFFFQSKRVYIMVLNFVLELFALDNQDYSRRVLPCTSYAPESKTYNSNIESITAQEKESY